MSNDMKRKKRTDCCVIAQGTEFHLDSFNIMTWSGYFRRYFTIDILEKDNMTVELNNISASTFQLILDMINTGDINMLRENNVNDVWHAAHQLQIAVLMKICSDFIVARLSLDNVAIFKRQADSLHALGVLKGILQIIMKNFSALSNSEVVLNLNREDLKQLVESDDLYVESEDVVLQAIFGWVNSNEKTRQKYLADLLELSRYCLLSYSCIAELRQHSLTLNDSRVKEILNKALSFKVDTCYMSGFWPTAAIYRASMGYDHIGVYCSAASKFVQLSLKKNEMIKSTDIPSLKASQLAFVNGNLVACSYTGELYTLTNKMWLRVGDFRLPACDESNIFVISRKKKLYRFNPNDWKSPIQESTYDIVSPRNAMSFYSQILLFSPVKYGGAEMTTVHAWYSDTNTWKMIGDLSKFTADRMTSFKDDSDGYILDSVGHLWKLTNSKTVVCTYIGQLWDVKVNLTGALLFMKSLYVFVAGAPKLVRLNLQSCQASGVFRDVRFYATGDASNVISVLKERHPSAAV